MGATFVGFGLGSIQLGLFLCEAQRTGLFDRYVVAEVDLAAVRGAKDAGGRLCINVAHPDRVEQVELVGIEVYDPQDRVGRREILQAIGDSDEMATAIPSVDLYRAGGRASIVRLLAEGLDSGKPRILYAAENHNHAAEILTQSIADAGYGLPGFQALDTVIGKMSGYVGSAQEATSLGLVPLFPEGGRAILVESFNRILISRVRVGGINRRLEVFQEKDDLLPFEEAKLYGHNAAHAVLGYLAAANGYHHMSEVAVDAKLMEAAQRVLVEECGPALVAEHAMVGDVLFTTAGWRKHSQDLLLRMTNPHLRDPVERVCRDPARKLGWDDRLIGAMRLVLRHGGEPRALARGVRGAVRYFVAEGGTDIPASPAFDGSAIRGILSPIWGPSARSDEAQECLRWITATDDPFSV